jgi:hypothetical protein
MFKIGFKASHYLSTNRVGKVVDIRYIKNNQWTIGGTTDSKVYITLEYKEKNQNNEIVIKRERYLSGDLIRIYD